MVYHSSSHSDLGIMQQGFLREITDFNDNWEFARTGGIDDPLVWQVVDILTTGAYKVLLTRTTLPLLGEVPCPEAKVFTEKFLPWDPKRRRNEYSLNLTVYTGTAVSL